MSSSPSSSRHFIFQTKELQNSSSSFESPSATPSLQYFNMRVTERLHRYRSLRRQWQDGKTPLDLTLNSKPLSPPTTLESSALSRNPTIELKVFSLSEQNPKEQNEKPLAENETLNKRIQQDLFNLRKLIKARQEKRAEQQQMLVKPTSSIQRSPEKVRRKRKRKISFCFFKCLAIENISIR